VEKHRVRIRRIDGFGCHDLGTTGIQVINIINGCTTIGSSILSAYWAIESGKFDLGVAVGFDKHAHGAFNRAPAVYGLHSGTRTRAS
jgi:acetyl-CoA acetyltransferase